MIRRVKFFGTRTLFDLEEQMNEFLANLTLNYHVKDIGMQKYGCYYIGHIFYYEKGE